MQSPKISNEFRALCLYPECMFPECMFPDQYKGCHLSRPVRRDGIYPGQYIGCHLSRPVHRESIGQDKCILYALVGHVLVGISVFSMPWSG